MNTADTFDITFWTLLASMLLMRGGFAFRVWRTGERLLADRAAKERDGWVDGWGKPGRRPGLMEGRNWGFRAWSGAS